MLFSRSRSVRGVVFSVEEDAAYPDWLYVVLQPRLKLPYPAVWVRRGFDGESTWYELGVPDTFSHEAPPNDFIEYAIVRAAIGHWAGER